MNEGMSDSISTLNGIQFRMSTCVNLVLLRHQVSWLSILSSWFFSATQQWVS